MFATPYLVDTERMPDALERCTEIHSSATKHKEDPRDSADSLPEELQESSILFCLIPSKTSKLARAQHNEAVSPWMGNDEFQNCLGGSSFSNIVLREVTSDTLEDN